MRPLLLKVFVGLATAAAAQCIVAQSHVQLIERTPCLYEYRVWAFTFRRPQPFPVPRDFTATQCTAAEQVHERIERERVEADAVPDPSTANPVIVSVVVQAAEEEAPAAGAAPAAEAKGKAAPKGDAKAPAAKTPAAKAPSAKK